jgi:hemerythrin-like metal-binding protein
MKSFNMLLAALGFGILVVAVILSFLAFGALHPAPWVLLAIIIAIPVINNQIEARSYVTWKDEYNVNVKLIDDDHKRLMNLINSLKMAVRYHTGETFEKQAMDELAKYTQVHFAREEKIMREHGYPGYEAHKAQHDAMMERVAGYGRDYEERGHDAIVDLAPLVKDWLINHIYKVDQEYAAFLKEKGLLDGIEIRECCCTGTLDEAIRKE